MNSCKTRFRKHLPPPPSVPPPPSLIGGAISLCAGILITMLGLASVGKALEKSLLLVDGVTTDAVVDARRAESDEEGERTFIRYRFQAAAESSSGDRSTRQEVLCSDKACESLEAGMTVAVRYVKSQPSISGLANDGQSLNLRIELFVFCLVSFWCLSAGLWFLTSAARMTWTWGWLCCCGKTAQGRVIGFWIDHSSDNGPAYGVVYAFTPPGLAEQFSAEYNRKVYNELEVDDVVAIRYAEGRPWICKLLT